jgi:hypothetical protein
MLFPIKDSEQKIDMVLCCDSRDKVCQQCAKYINNMWVASQTIESFGECQGCGDSFDTMNVVILWSKCCLSAKTHENK